MGPEDITTPYMIVANHTDKGNSTGHVNVPLVVGLSVGLPLALLVITALVLGLVWARRRSAASFEPNADPNPPKTIQDYPPISSANYPPVSTSDPVYENYQPGGSSAYMGPQPPAIANRHPRNEYHNSPRRADPGDNAIYANVPSTFPSRT